MSLTLFTKEKSRRLSRRVISLTLSTALAVNSLLAGMPVFNVAVAETPTSQITNVDAYYSSGTGYTGIGIDFTTLDVTNATDVELIVHGDNDCTASIHGESVLLNAINNSTTTKYTTSGTVVITGFRSSSSGSWENMTGDWAGSCRPLSAEVKITLEGGDVLTKTDATIVDKSGNTQESVFAKVPEITSVDAYYSVGSEHTAISVDFGTKNVKNATNIELRVNRTDNSPYSITATDSTVESINNATTYPTSTTGPIVVTGSRSSGSWNDQTGTWVGSALPKSVDVIITLEGGTTFSMRDDAIGETKALLSEVMPKARNATDNISYTSIKKAINATDTESGDVIEAFDGVHDSFGTSFGGDENLTIKPYAGANPVIAVAADSTERLVDLRADGTTLEGFTIRSTNVGNGVGISMSGQNLVVRGNSIENTLTGIQTTSQYPAGKSEILNNTIIAKHGISLQNDNNHVYNNDITSSVEGFGVGFKDYIITDNIIEYNNIVATSGEQAHAHFGALLNVTKNWWGSVNGADDTKLVNNVIATPWLCQPWQDGDRTSAEGDGDCDVTPVVESVTVNSTSITRANHATTHPIIHGESQKIYINLENPDEMRAGFLMLNKAVDDGNPKNSDKINYALEKDGEGNWFALVDATNLMSGEYLIKVEAHGKSTPWGYFGNNSGWTSPNYHLIVDNTGPDVSGVVLNGQNVSDADIRSKNCTVPSNYHLVNGVIDLSATLSDDYSDVTNATYKIRKVSSGGCTQTAIYQSNTTKMISDTDDSWVTLQSSAIDTAADEELVDGNYTIQMTLKDSLGNQSTRYVDIAVDNTAPAQPQVLGFYKDHNTNSNIVPCGGYTNTTKIQIDWADNDEDDIAGYWFGTKHNQKHKWVENHSRYNANMTPGHDPYFYTVIAVDHAGNESVISKQCDLMLDADAPAASITSPATDGEEVSGVVNVTGEAVDENIKSHWFEITGPNGYVEHFYNLNTTDLTHSFNWNTTEVEDGEYRIRYVATDRAGNRSDNPNFSKPTLRVVQVKNTPVVTGDYFVAEEGQLNVGFYVQGFTDANKVTVTLYDVEDSALTVNQGDSDLILALLNSSPTNGISSPFYIPNGADTDGYWMFGNPDWLALAKPAYAIVTVTSNKYGDISSSKINFTSPGERGFSYEELIAAIEEDEDEGGEVEGATKGKSNAQKGLQVAANRTNNNQDKGNNQGQGHERVNLLLTQANNGNDDQDEPVDKDDNNRNEVKNQNDEGEVAGESSSNEFKVVGAANDEGCGNLFGICWYWYVPVVIAMAGGYFYYNNRRRDQAINSRLRR